VATCRPPQPSMCSTFLLQPPKPRWKGSSAVRSHRAASRRSGLLFRHSPQGRLFVACLVPTSSATTSWLGQPRHRGSRRRSARRRDRTPVSLPCPRWDRGASIHRGGGSLQHLRHLRHSPRRVGILSRAPHRVASRHPGSHSVILHKVGCSWLAWPRRRSSCRRGWANLATVVHADNLIAGEAASR